MQYYIAFWKENTRRFFLNRVIFIYTRFVEKVSSFVLPQDKALYLIMVDSVFFESFNIISAFCRLSKRSPTTMNFIKTLEFGEKIKIARSYIRTVWKLQNLSSIMVQHPFSIFRGLLLPLKQTNENFVCFRSHRFRNVTPI